MRFDVTVAVLVIVAILSIVALVTGTEIGQKATLNQSETEQTSLTSSTPTNTRLSAISSQLSSAQTSSRGPTTVNMTAETSTACQTLTLESFGVKSTVVSCDTITTESLGNMTLHVSDVCYPLPANFVENSTLTSSIQGSFFHNLIYSNYNQSNPAHLSAVFNVTGTQLVHGNWTGGYQISYTDNELVNVSETLTTPSNYAVTHVAHYPLPDRSYSDTYTTQQQGLILAALSNSTVQSDLADTRYYVYGVSIDNASSTAGVVFLQVNGPNEVSAVLDPTTLKVVELATGQLSFIGPWNPQFGC